MDRTEWLLQTSPVEDMPEDLVKEVKLIMDKIELSSARDDRFAWWHTHKAVSYTHLTLPTICSV